MFAEFGEEALLGVSLGGFALGKPCPQPIQFREKVTSLFGSPIKSKLTPLTTSRQQADNLVSQSFINGYTIAIVVFECSVLLVLSCKSLHHNHIPDLQTHNAQMAWCG